MNCIIDLRKEIRVSVDGKTVDAPYPTVATAALLVTLAESFPSSVSRLTLAKAVHPEQHHALAQNALRQTLHRLRKWLGPEFIRAAKQQVALVGDWQVLHPKEFGAKIGDLPSHPVFDRYLQEARAESAPVGSSKLFDLVIDLARQDVDIARDVLVSAPVLIESCSEVEVWRMFQATRPSKANSTRAAEYFILRSQQAMRFADFNRAIEDAINGYRIARHSNRRTLLAEAASMILFHCLEAGDMDQASFWLSELFDLQSVVSTRVLAINAEIAFYWNAGDVERAAVNILRGKRAVKRASRRTKLHFYVNASVFKAENRQPNEAVDFLELAESLAVPGFDIASSQMVRLAKGEIELASGNPARAISICQESMALPFFSEFRAGQNYFFALLARSYARLGDREMAEMYWNMNESCRRQAGGSLAPRLAAQRAEVFGNLI